ncbi:MAG TPA: tetratricopeptide repeat protein, partial [Anaerolineales bacterium]|nr:tetratricopeptide repeat protein [Anaerolineales bacterium]
DRKLFQIDVSNVISSFLMCGTLPKTNLPPIGANDQALFRCRKALDLKAKGDYAGAQKVMRPLWQRVGDWPNTTGLHPSVAAEVLFCTGILTSWIGSKNAISEANDTAKDLLNESLTYYQAVRDIIMIAAVQIELGYRSWRIGLLDEARLMFNEALNNLTIDGHRRANALCGLSMVEWSALRFEESLKILTDSEPLFDRITNPTLKGAYHNQMAITLRSLVEPENKVSQLQRVLNEYKKAARHFEAAHNKVFRGALDNNISCVLRELSRFKEAHAYLDHARRLTVNAKDKVTTAKVDESRAQLFIAEGKYSEAESAVKQAVKVFEKSGHHCFLAEALTTHGITLARLGKIELAQFTIQRAIAAADQAGLPKHAGIAALTLIEEIDDLSADMLARTYEQAAEWLVETQSHALLLRFRAAGKKLAARLKTPARIRTTETIFKYRN